MKFMKSSWVCVFMLCLTGCQSLPLQTQTDKEGPFRASYRVENKKISLYIVNKGNEDVLLEIPKLGLLYRIEVSKPDGRSGSFANGRVIGITSNSFKVVRKSPSSNTESHESSFSSEIPLRDDFKNVKRVELVFNYVKISDLRLVGNLYDLECLLGRNSQRCEAVLLEAKGSVISEPEVRNE
jgi:hypothetical protein